MTTDDMELLRDYTRNNSEQAFAALVSRYVNLVYSVAFRQVHDSHLAEEITQAVFIILAQKAASFDNKVILSGWLCRTAHYASVNALKIQRRRQRREHEAYMQSLLTDPEPGEWARIAPLLDTALARLNRKDYDAIVLRFFENKDLREVGAALGASEEAAKKRVSRALEKLEGFFLKQGVTSSAPIIAQAISAHSIQTAPAALAKSATTVAVAKGAATATSTLNIVKGALKVMAWSHAKTATVAAAVLLLVVAGTITATVIVGKAHPKPPQPWYVPGTVLNNDYNRVVVPGVDRQRVAKLRADAWPKEKQATEEKIKSRQAVDETLNAMTIDLKPYINAQLSDGPIGPRGNEKDNLAELPGGVHVYGGVPFDVEGVIYLTGGQMWKFKKEKDYPLEMDGIKIGRRCAKIHLFHGGSLISFRDYGKTIAKLVLHYSDGSSEELNIDAGKQVIDWWAPLFHTGVSSASLKTEPGTEVAWSGRNPEIKHDEPDESLVLCKTTFNNPKPDVDLTSIDYVSMNTMMVPFMVGLTVE